MISRSNFSCRLAIRMRGNSFSWQNSCAASRIARSSSVSCCVEPQRVVPLEMVESALAARSRPASRRSWSVSVLAAPLAAGDADVATSMKAGTSSPKPTRRAEVVVAPARGSRLHRRPPGFVDLASARPGSARAARVAVARGARSPGCRWQRRASRALVPDAPPRAGSALRLGRFAAARPRASGRLVGVGSPASRVSAARRASPGGASPRPGRAPAAVALGPIDRIEPLDGDARDRVAGQLLDRLHREPVVRRGDGEGAALQPGAAGAADAMDVVLGVDAARRN